MKHILLVIAVVFLASCTRKSDPTSPSDAVNLSFKIGGSEVAVKAIWKTIPNNRVRIYWEEGSGSSYKNIEIDFYGSATGDYAVVVSPSTGQAGFQYYIQSGANYQGESGTISLTSFSNEKMTGTFSLVAKDGSGNSHQLSEGKFTNIPKE
jgi:hypothetical protein